MAHYESLFKPHTRLVSEVLANNEVGVIQDIRRCADIAHEHGALIHTDAVQAFGKCNVNVVDMAVDFLTVSGHKIYAPKGVGALYFKDHHWISSLLHGGHHEHSLRASTENVPGIIAFAEAIKAIDVDTFQVHTKSLSDTFKQQFVNHDSFIINSTAENTLSNTVNISVKGCDGQALAMNCDLAGINVSTGSACSVGSIEPSHVLQAMGISDDNNKSSLRFSFGLENTHDDIHHVAETLNLW